MLCCLTCELLVEPPCPKAKVSREAQNIRPGADSLNGCAPLIRVHGKVAALQGEQVVRAAICPARCLALEVGWEIRHGWHLHDQHSISSTSMRTHKVQNHFKAQALLQQKGDTLTWQSLPAAVAQHDFMEVETRWLAGGTKRGGTWHPRHALSPATGLCPASNAAELCHHTALVWLGFLMCAHATGAALVLLSLLSLLAHLLACPEGDRNIAAAGAATSRRLSSPCPWPKPCPMRSPCLGLCCLWVKLHGSCSLRPCLSGTPRLSQGHFWVSLSLSSL